MINKVTKCVVFLILICVVKLNGQHAAGLYVGNYNSPYTAFFNPANTLTPRNELYFNLWGSNLGFTNNFIEYNAPFRLGNWVNKTYDSKYDGASGLKFNQAWLPLISEGNDKKAYYLRETYGPSLFFRVGRATAIGFGVKTTTGISLKGVNMDMAKLIRFGIDSAKGAQNNGLAIGKNYSTGPFSLNMAEYTEFFFSLAGTTRDVGPHYWKWGATGKMLFGLGAANMNGKNLQYGFNNKKDFYVQNADAQFSHTNSYSVNQIPANPLGLGWEKDLNGLGLGMDIGFIYEHRPNALRKSSYRRQDCFDETLQSYDWKVGASLTDLGFLVFDGTKYDFNSKNKFIYQANKNTLPTVPFSQDFNNHNLWGMDSAALALGGTEKSGFAQSTPAMLNIQFDAKVAKNWYLAANLSQNLKRTSSAGFKKASYFNIIPRYEYKYYELGFPISITRDYSQANVGIYGRVGPFILGTDNIGGLMKMAANSNYQSANVYFAARLRIGICHHYYTREEIVKNDSLDKIKSDTSLFWDTIAKADTVPVNKEVHDTVYKFKTIRDTIFITKTTEVQSADQKRKEAELKKREEELAKKEAAVKAKEEALKKSENTNMSNKSDCDKKVIDLEEQLRKQRNLYADLENRYNIVKNDRDNLENKLRIANSELDVLRNENIKLRNENTVLRSQIDQLQIEISRLKLNANPCAKQTKTLDSLLRIEQSNNVKIKAQLEESNNKVQVLSKESDVNKKKIADLENEIRILKEKGNSDPICAEKLKKAEADLAAEKANSVKIKSQLDDLTKKNSDLTSENAKFTEQLKNCGNDATLKAKIADLENQLRAAKDEVIFYSNKLKECEEKVKNCANSDELTLAKTKVSNLEKEVSELKAQVAANKKAKEDAEAKLADCQKNNGSDEIEKLKLELAAQKSKCDEADKEVAKLKSENSDLTAKVAAANKKIGELEDELKKCNNNSNSDEINQLKQEVSDLKAQVVSKNAALSELQAKLNEERNKNSKLQDEIESLKSQLSKACDEVKAENSDLKGKVASQNSEINTLKAKIAALQKELDEKSCDVYINDLQKCRDNASELNATIASLKTQVMNLNSKVTLLEQQLKDCQDK